PPHGARRCLGDGPLRIRSLREPTRAGAPWSRRHRPIPFGHGRPRRRSIRSPLTTSCHPELVDAFTTTRLAPLLEPRSTTLSTTPPCENNK
uniref:Uncharacterized protein n=1 Tax=Triticum urartu TaxID=4572 RepID=A0A8R7Q835_TRIUA